jgi:hypothetical protein
MKPIVLSGLGVVACFATFTVANWIKPIASFLPIPLLWLLFALLAAGVYLARLRARPMYAIWEIYVGAFALGTAALRAPMTDSYNVEQRNLFFISLVGGIFLVVRGLDNAKQSVPEALRALDRWGRRRSGDNDTAA